MPPSQPSPVQGHHRVNRARRQSKWELPSLRPWPKNGQRSRGPPAGVTTVPPARPDPELALPHRQTGKEGGFPSLSVSVTSARLRPMQAFTQAFQPPARSQTPILTRFLNSGEARVTSPLPRIGVLRGEELETHRDLEN